MAVPIRFANPVTVAMRAPDQIQVGLDAGRSVVLADAPPGADRALRAFTSWCTPARAVTVAPTVDPLWLSQALAALIREGLLVQATPRARSVTPRACTTWPAPASPTTAPTSPR